tara:strand:+ start:1853 stop:2197 length:345 start_codon:yes stop_codon:yes gene_type:complete
MNAVVLVRHRHDFSFCTGVAIGPNQNRDEFWVMGPIDGWSNYGCFLNQILHLQKISFPFEVISSHQFPFMMGFRGACCLVHNVPLQATKGVRFAFPHCPPSGNKGVRFASLGDD